MTDSMTTSHELRQFATENSGRRKINVEASIELHNRAASQIDALREHIAGLEQRLSSGDTSPSPTPPASPPVEDPTKAALLLLQNAQATADQTLAEADLLKSEAEETRQQADAVVRAKVDAALSEARGQALHIVEVAEAEVTQTRESGEKLADRAAFIQRQTTDRTARLRADAEEMVDFAKGMEALAADETARMLTETHPVDEPTPIGTDVVDSPTPETATTEPALAAPPLPADIVDVAPAHLAPPAPQSPTEAPAAATSLLPPPPASAILELNEDDLEKALDGKSIDDELFEDDVVIDLTDRSAASAPSQGFEAFGKE